MLIESSLLIYQHHGLMHTCCLTYVQVRTNYKFSEFKELKFKETWVGVKRPYVQSIIIYLLEKSYSLMTILLLHPLNRIGLLVADKKNNWSLKRNPKEFYSYDL